jgi:hypothetical protein
MPLVGVKQVSVGVEVKDAEAAVNATIEGLHQGNGHRVVSAQKQGEGMLQNLGGALLHGLKVTGPLQVRRHIPVVPYSKPKGLALLGARREVRG